MHLHHNDVIPITILVMIKHFDQQWPTQQKDRLYPFHLHGCRWKSPEEQNVNNKLKQSLMTLVVLDTSKKLARLNNLVWVWAHARHIEEALEGVACPKKLLERLRWVPVERVTSVCLWGWGMRMRMLMIMMMLVMLMMIFTSTSTPTVGLQSLFTKPIIHIPLLLVTQHLTHQKISTRQKATLFSQVHFPLVL